MVQIKDVSIDLRKIGIDFDLNEDQINALNNLADFLEDSNTVCTTLSGSAGTGKTACTRVLLEYVKSKYKDEYFITLAAPTHKAKSVLKRLAGSNNSNVTTLHKLLNLKPIVNIAEFDAKDIQFIDAFDLDFVDEIKNLIIIDESSLINDILFDLIISKLGSNAKIIFLGDHAQLAPVKQDELSKVFNSVDYEGSRLTKVERQVNGNPLSEILITLRDKYILPKDFNTAISNDNNSGIIIHSNTKDFIREIKKSYENELEFEGGLNSKVLCFTNNRVSQYNVAIRKVLGYKNILVKGEILSGTDNYTSDRVYKDPFSKESVGYAKYGEIYNANDYILYDMKESKKSIPFYRTIDGLDITLIDTTDNLKHSMFLLNPDAEKSEYDDLASTLENLRLKAIDKTTPYMSKKSYWSAWYAINKSFVSLYDLVYDQRVVKKASLVYGYATTVHKSQGSSYNNVFVDMLDIMRCIDKNAIRSLQYVALSRARMKAHILC